MQGITRLLALLAPLGSGFALGAIEHLGTPELEVEARVVGSSVDDPLQIDVLVDDQVVSVDDVAGRLGNQVSVHFRVGRLTDRVYVQRVEAQTFDKVLEDADEFLRQLRSGQSG